MKSRGKLVSEDTLLDLIDSIYAAAGDDTLWPVFLNKLSNTFSGGNTPLIDPKRSQRLSLAPAVWTDLATFLRWVRSRHRKNLGEGELAVLRVILPHLRRASQVQGRIANLNGETQSLQSVLNRLATGTITVNASGEVVEINQAARHICSDNDGIVLDGKRIRVACRREDTELKHLLKTALMPSVSEDRPSYLMRVSRPSLRNPYSVVVVPAKLDSREHLFATEPRTVVFITDPEAAPIADAAVLRSVFGFTRAETRLASALMRGLSLREISEETRLSLNTLRTQLKGVFRKTNTNRQGELIMVLARASGALATDR